MKKKNKIHISLPVQFSYDAPVTLTFVFLSLLLFMLNKLAFHNSLDFYVLASPTKAGGEMPFAFNNVFSYLRLFLYALGSTDWISLFASMIFILLLGPAIEDYYGSVIIGLMMIVSTLFAAVLNTCFSSIALRGPVPVIFMLIFLNAFISFSKKKVPLTFVTAFVIFICYLIFGMKEGVTTGVPAVLAETADVTEVQAAVNSTEVAKEVVMAEKNILSSADIAIKVCLCLAGGLCGSLFAFLGSTKKRRTAGSRSSIKSTTENNTRQKTGKARIAEDEEETVVGTIHFD